MSVERLRTHYDDKYAHESTQESGVRPVPIRQRHPFGRTAAALHYLPGTVAGKDVLEIGAGDGVIPESLRAGGVDFRSYTLGDLSQQRLAGMRRRLRDDRYRFVVVDGDDPLATLGGQRFDVVVTLDVIEHLLDPITAMRETREALRPGGFVFLNTPNVARWTHRVELLLGRFPATASTDEGLRTYSGRPVDLRDEGHFHYFTFRALSRMLTQRCGYSRVVPAPYNAGPGWLRGPVGHRLACAQPRLFSGLAVFAYA